MHAPRGLASTARGLLAVWMATFTNEMLLPLPSYLAAVAGAAGVLLLLSHPQHAHASAVIGAFAILALCETMFALQAVDDKQCTEAHRRLTIFLLTAIGWCIAAMPLAVAFFVQGRAAPESDSLARAALLVRLGAVYLVGTVSADLFVREEPFSSDHAHDCARINERGGLEVWAREVGSSDAPPAWWAAPGAQGQACLLLAGVALSELQSLRHAAVLAALALGAQALPVLAGWSRGDGGWWPAGLCVSCVLVADRLCGAHREKLRAAAAAHPTSAARRLAGCMAGLVLLAAAALLGAWHRAEALFWLRLLLLQPSELALLCCIGAAAACLCFRVLEVALLRACGAYAGTPVARMLGGPLPWQQAAYEAQRCGGTAAGWKCGLQGGLAPCLVWPLGRAAVRRPSAAAEPCMPKSPYACLRLPFDHPGPNRCLAPGTHLPPLNLISEQGASRKRLPTNPYPNSDSHPAPNLNSHPTPNPNP